MKEVTGVYNEKYFSRWFDRLDKPRFKRYYQYIVANYETKFAKYGYSLIKEPGNEPERVREAEEISATDGALLCLSAEAYALMVRSFTQSKAYVKTQLRIRLPGPVKTVIRACLEKSDFTKKQPDSVRR